MFSRTLQGLAFLVLVFLLALVGCQPAAPPGHPEATEPASSQPTATENASLPAATETPVLEPGPEVTADPLANCPGEEAGKRLYTSEINGFCFLYPDGFTIQPDELHPDEVVKLVGPTEEAGPKQQEVATVTLWVANNGPADVADSAAYAQKWRELNVPAGDPNEITQESTTIGGHPAEVLDWLPGMIRQQTGFVVADDNKYTVTISPAPGFVTDLDEPVKQAWNTVAN